MSDMTARALVTNEQVAQNLGISHSMVSRIRSGDRLPSYTLMHRIEAALQWTIADQVTATRPPITYAQEFELALVRRYG